MVMMDLKEKETSWEDSCENKKCCTDCKTTKTPLWRGGPAGPKTLCNACGIRYRKRRACAVGLNKAQDRKGERGQSTSVSVSDSDLKRMKMNIMGLDEEVLLQQRIPSVLKKQRWQRRRKLGEEEQAAFCLMALSCGFVFA